MNSQKKKKKKELNNYLFLIFEGEWMEGKITLKLKLILVFLITFLGCSRCLWINCCYLEIILEIWQLVWSVVKSILINTLIKNSILTLQKPTLSF